MGKTNKQTKCLLKTVIEVRTLALNYPSKFVKHFMLIGRDKSGIIHEYVDGIASSEEQIIKRGLCNVHENFGGYYKIIIGGIAIASHTRSDESLF